MIYLSLYLLIPFLSIFLDTEIIVIYRVIINKISDFKFSCFIQKAQTQQHYKRFHHIYAKLFNVTFLEAAKNNWSMGRNSHELVVSVLEASLLQTCSQWQSFVRTAGPKLSLSIISETWRSHYTGWWGGME